MKPRTDRGYGQAIRTWSIDDPTTMAGTSERRSSYRSIATERAAQYKPTRISDQRVSAQRPDDARTHQADPERPSEPGRYRHGSPDRVVGDNESWPSTAERSS